jgi:hypothetical protein
MGLDVYVGPFTRYFCGDWKTVVQQQSEVPVMVVRPPGQEIDDSLNPAEVEQDLHSWRQMLNQGPFKGNPLDWHESASAPYFTDKPDWDAYASLQLWAAYSFQPKMKRPDEFVEDWEGDPAYQACSYNGELKPKPATQCQLVLGCEWWLPCSVPGIFQLVPPGRDTPVQVGSSLDLVEELEKLNARTWKASEEQLADWMRAGSEPRAPLEQGAKFAFAVFLELARQATQNKLPMLLDY